MCQRAHAMAARGISGIPAVTRRLENGKASRSRKDFPSSARPTWWRRLENDIGYPLPSRHAADILRDKPGAALHGAFRPARHMRCREHVGELVERVAGGER